LIARVVTALVFGAVLIGAVFLLPPLGAAGVFALLWLGGAWEWGAFARFAGMTRIAYLALVAAVMLSAPYWLRGEAAFGGLLSVAVLWWGTALVSLMSYRAPIPPAITAATGFLVLVPGWYTIAYMLAYAPGGAALIFVALLVVWSADVGAFFSGRWLGRTKLAPRVSPGKTWEGVAGGAVFAALVGGGAGYALALPTLLFALLAVASALVSVVGDLTVSRFKRNVGLKDSGHWLPGHGGVLDRIDSLTAALPAYALGLKLTGLVP
jgi:phosphatidate cytidylyltransferase